MRVVTLIFVFSFPSIISFSQEQNYWQVLAEVGFQTRKDKDGNLLEVPVFSANLKSIEGKKIKLKGYVIPVSEVGDQNKFMFSSMSCHTCYFCGAAGPETVIEVESDQSIPFTTKAIIMEGILRLNNSDSGHHMYLLKVARIVSPPSSTQ